MAEPRLKSALSAREIWKLLVPHSKAGTHPHYADISREFNVKGGHSWMIPSLDQIQNYCIAHDLPPLTSLVVKMKSERPGDRYQIRFGSIENDWEKTHGHDWASEPVPTPDQLGAARTRKSSVHAGSSPPPLQTEGTRLARYRIGMDAFRKGVLRNFGGACCVCGIANDGLVEAAHIRGWAKDPSRRLAVNNGLALCVLHHRAKDREILSVEAPGIVKVKGKARKGDGFFGRAVAAFHGKPIAKPQSPVEL